MESRQHTTDRRPVPRGRRPALAVALAVAAGTLVAAGPAPAAAGALASPAASAWTETQQTAVRLVAATTAVGTAGTVPLGLEFRLDKGWKIYWRTPGDAGFPPHLKWQGSANLAAATLRWPVPERFSVLGLETLGYEGTVVLPVTARLAKPGQPLHLRATVDYLTCKDICIPYTAALALDLPAGPASASPFAHLIARFAARVPGDGAAHGVAIRRVALAGVGKAATLHVEATSMAPFTHPDVFVEGPAELTFGRPAVTLSDRGHQVTAVLAIRGLDHFKGSLTTTPLTVTLADGLRSAERTLVPQAAAGGLAAAGTVGPASLAVIVGLALLGGLILNLMPCVLPVLSIKLLAVVGHGGQAGSTVRQSFVASAAGIVASFLVLAAALIGIKVAGGVIGWGIQFQQAWFLIAMALIVTLFACNLWGFFDIRLPAAFANFGGRGGAGGLAGSFASGAFATLLATPCSAPFLGTAIGFALARGAPEILLVFTALGLGLAAPYLGVAAFPALVTHLPKPGRWMVWLCRIMGFALAATAGWLLSVLASTVGPTGTAAIGAVLVAIAGLLAMRQRLNGHGRPAAALAVAALAAIAFVVPGAAGSRPAPRDAAALSQVWQPFDEAAIPDLVREGVVVFVDVTADWCLTCQVNKTFVLERQPVVNRLRQPGVVAMAADWTRPNAAIARYLARYGRYGIPFNAVYGPAAPHGIVLPELLTEAAVEDALNRAAAAN